MPTLATSLDAIKNGSTPQRRRVVNRNNLTIGDLFVDSKGRTHMFTGFRTRPPSGGDGVTVHKGGTKLLDTTAPSLGTTKGGQVIIGYQSIVVEGSIKTGSDGASVRLARGTVTWVGRASIELDKV